jgi:hypothetical protein
MTLVFVALTLVAMMAFAGLAVDLGHAYVQNRQMQNASDTASLTATHKLYAELYTTADATDPPGTLLATAQASATTNNANVAAADCWIVGEPTAADTPPPVLGSCPTGGSGTELSALGSCCPGFAGVKVTARATSSTGFMRAVGITTFSNVGTAAALIESGVPGAGDTPIIMCAVGQGDPNSGSDGIVPGGDLGTYENADRTEGPAILIPSGGTEVVNPAAQDQWYQVRGAGSVNVPECGSASGKSWKGDTDGATYSMPGTWQEGKHDLGNSLNKQLINIAGFQGCPGQTSPLYDANCVGLIAIPLCYSDGGSGSLYCLQYGVFLIFDATPNSSAATASRRSSAAAPAVPSCHRRTVWRTSLLPSRPGVSTGIAVRRVGGSNPGAGEARWSAPSRLPPRVPPPMRPVRPSRGEDGFSHGSAGWAAEQRAEGSTAVSRGGGSSSITSRGHWPVLRRCRRNNVMPPSDH